MLKKNPFHIMVKPIGSRCNLNCSYCFYLEKENLWSTGNRFRMSEDALETYVKSHLELQEGDDVNFAWQGGEPTLMGIDFFRKAVVLQRKYANGKRISNSLQTNGTLLDSAWVDFFKENEFLIGVSVDGPRKLHDVYRVGKKGHGTWDSVMRGIEFLRSAGVEWNSLTCVHRGNQEKPLDVYRFLKGMGSRYMQFIPIVERKPNSEAVSLNLTHSTPDRIEDDLGLEHQSCVHSWSVNPSKYGSFMLEIFSRWIQKDVGKIFVQLHDNTLGKWFDPKSSGLCVFEETCGTAMALEHDGSLYSCDHYVYPDYRLGNIFKQDMGSLVWGSVQRKFGENKRDTLPRQCLECSVLALCNGGCPKHRFLKDRYGNPGLNYLCDGYYRFFSQTAPFMKEMVALYRVGKAPSEIMKLYPRGMKP